MIYDRRDNVITIVRLATQADYQGHLKDVDKQDLESGMACIVRCADGKEQLAIAAFLIADHGWNEVRRRMKELGARFATKERENFENHLDTFESHLDKIIL